MMIRFNTKCPTQNTIIYIKEYREKHSWYNGTKVTEKAQANRFRKLYLHDLNLKTTVLTYKSPRLGAHYIREN